MKKNIYKQYTIRQIPMHVDRILRQRAQETNKSFNQITVEALTMATLGNLRPKRDFNEIIGSLSDEEAMTQENEIRRQHQVDKKMWE